MPLVLRRGMVAGVRELQPWQVNRQIVTLYCRGNGGLAWTLIGVYESSGLKLGGACMTCTKTRLLWLENPQEPSQFEPQAWSQ